VKITCIQFCAIPPHEGVNVVYSLSKKVEYATGITLVRLSSYRVQCKKGFHSYSYYYYYNKRNCQTIFDLHRQVLILR
jgi:hypothetical protein